MKASVKADWIRALRSGDYDQATSCLKDAEGAMCCLGVLCDLSNKAGVGEWKGRDFWVGEEGRTSSPPLGVRQWAGTSHRFSKVGVLPGFAFDGESHALTELNDGGLNFAQIADVIDHFVDGVEGEG